MPDVQSFYPLEFCIGATPRSLQASSESRRRWKNTVSDAARVRIEDVDELGFVDERPVAVTIFYFLNEPMEGDIDNIVKPIVDALIGRAYLNDRQVERVIVQKIEPQFGVRFIETSAKLAEALDTVPPLVYVRVDDDLSWRTIV